MDRLRELRIRAGYSQQELANAAGVAQHTISEIELDRRTPRGKTLRKLARALKVEVVDLLESPEAPKVPAPPSPEPVEEVEDEERREELRNVRKALVDGHELLETWFKKYEAARDGRKLTELTAVAILSSLGAWRFVQEEVGPMSDRDSERVYLAGTRYEELIDDLLKALGTIQEGDTEEEEVGVLIDLRERLRSKKAS